MLVYNYNLSYVGGTEKRIVVWSRPQQTWDLSEK
jgi:hypothetical protein